MQYTPDGKTLIAVARPENWWRSIRRARRGLEIDRPGKVRSSEIAPDGRELVISFELASDIGERTTSEQWHLTTTPPTLETERPLAPTTVVLGVAAVWQYLRDGEHLMAGTNSGLIALYPRHGELPIAPPARQLWSKSLDAHRA